jgi:hypothetical protein
MNTAFGSAGPWACSGAAPNTTAAVATKMMRAVNIAILVIAFPKITKLNMTQRNITRSAFDPLLGQRQTLRADDEKWKPDDGSENIARARRAPAPPFATLWTSVGIV